MEDVDSFSLPVSGYKVRISVNVLEMLTSEKLSFQTIVFVDVLVVVLQAMSFVQMHLNTGFEATVFQTVIFLFH